MSKSWFALSEAASSKCYCFFWIMDPVLFYNDTITEMKSANFRTGEKFDKYLYMFPKFKKKE